MKCPVCTNVDLAMTDRQGIEIDYCPTCRGVWLDRGELDKIIDRSAAPAPTQAPPAYSPPPHREHRDTRHHSSGGYKDHDYYKRKKKSSLLGELFDF